MDLKTIFDKDKLSAIQIKNPRDVFTNILKYASGTSYTRELRYSLFYKIFAFRGVTQGVGTSTLVANTALAIAEAGLTVCVIDTSILAPAQDVLLKTAVSVEDGNTTGEILDWFDMPYTKKSPLHVSKLNKNISVLSFKGKGRTVVDYLSTNDSSSLVEIALTELSNKFDVILIDTCDEMTSVNTTCLQMSQQVIQVWNDSPTVLSSLESFITNSITLSCPLDKMRFVVYSRLCKDVIGTLDNIIKQYRLKHIATSYMSEEVYLMLVSGQTLFQAPSSNELVIEYTNCILDVVCHILNITEGREATGTITSNDIMEGKVEGTYHKELKDFNETFAKNHPEIVIDNNPMGADLDKYNSEKGMNIDVVTDNNSVQSGTTTQDITPNAGSLPDLKQYDAVLPEHEEDVEQFKTEQESKKKYSSSKGFFGKLFK